MEPLLPAGKSAAEALGVTPFSDSVVEIADSVLRGRIPILGREIELGDEIRWDRDYVNGTEWRES